MKVTFGDGFTISIGAYDYQKLATRNVSKLTMQTSTGITNNVYNRLEYISSIHQLLFCINILYLSSIMNGHCHRVSSAIMIILHM